MEQEQPKTNKPEEPAIDKDSSTDLVDRSIEIFDDGSALVKETTVTTVKMAPRDFISWMRKHETARDNIKETLSDDVRKATEKELAKVEEDIVNLKPYIEDSEKKAIAHYEKLKTEGMIKRVTEELDKNMADINLEYMNQVWSNLIQNEEDVLNGLTGDQKKKFLKIKVRFMSKNRGKRR